MIKNRKSTYILIPIVLIVWIIIVVQIFFSNSNSKENFVGFKERTGSHISKNLYYENYSLKLYNSDPFNMKAQFAASLTISKESSNLKRKLIKKINYYGFIKQENKVLANVSINNKFFIAKVNQQIDDFTIKRITCDSIIIHKEKGEDYTIKKLNH